MRLLHPGHVADDLERGDRPQAEVIVPADLRLLGPSVLPRHQEHRETLLDNEAHQRIGRLQIHDVELVDARRHDQQRRLMNLLGQRRILDQLHQLILVDHRAGGHRQIAPYLEGAVVGHRNATFFEILEQILDAPGDALTLGLDRRLEKLRVGRGEIRRRHGIDVLSRQELDSLLGASVFDRQRIGNPAEKLRVDQIRLPEVIEHRALVPFRRRETAIARRRRNYRLRGLARLALHQPRPQCGVAGGQVALQLQHPFRARQRHAFGHGRDLSRHSALLIHELKEILGQRLPELENPFEPRARSVIGVGHQTASIILLFSSNANERIPRPAGCQAIRKRACQLRHRQAAQHPDPDLVMYIIAIAWLYVALMVSIADTSVVGGVMTFLFSGLAPLALFLWIFGAPARKRTRLARERQESRQRDAPDRSGGQADEAADR